MKRYKRLLLKVISFPHIRIKKIYRQYRRFLTFVNSFFKPLYNLWDHKIMAGDREIPVRIFQPCKNTNMRIFRPNQSGKSGIYQANQSCRPGILIFFHGGGWVTGNIDSYTKVCANMANQTGHIVISVDYRLAPEYPFPAGLEDCYQAAREVFLKLGLMDCMAENITLIGDSAGGNLAAAVSLMARDRGEFQPGRQILIYPATFNDHSENSPFASVKENGTDYILTSKRIQDYMELYIQNGQERDNPYFAPLLAENLSNQPDTLIITAEFDPLRDEAEEYGRRLRESGNRVQVHRMKDALHGFFSLPWTSEYVIKCYNIINGFLG